MDRIINVKVGGSHLSKDNKNAGVKGEANVTFLRIIFDAGWDYFAKTVTFWDALGSNPVKRTLTADLIEDITKDTRVYLVSIPAEPMAIAGELTFVIDGYLDGKRQRSISDKLIVKDAPITDNAAEPVDPTPTQAEQLQGQIDKFMDDVQVAVIARDETKVYRDEAEGFSQSASKDAQNAQTTAEYILLKVDEAEQSAIKAENAVGKTSYIGDNGNWYAWNGSYFYDTGVKAQSGSTVYCGDNPPEEADVWVDPNGGEYAGGDVIVDDVLDHNSHNPISNRAVTEAIDNIEGTIEGIDSIVTGMESDLGGLYDTINNHAHFKGYFFTIAELRECEATPNDYAYVAESGTKWIYLEDYGWKNSLKEVPDQITPASDLAPLMDGDADAGSFEAYARGDHRHPTDTTRASAAELNALKADIEEGLDRIIAIQNTLIGGGSV